MNPALKRLGYDEQDRVVILHADDIGMCQATLPALEDLLDAGLISSAATMVPCPWFPQVAAYCQEYRDVDMGVHLTLTCEYRSYRWGPLSTRDRASGLMDEDGYLHFGPDGLHAHATPEAVARELVSQVEHARWSGIDVTHIDTHQLSALHPKFLSAYTSLAVAFRLPLMLLRMDADGWQTLAQAVGLAFDQKTAHRLARAVKGLEAQRMPLVDQAVMLPLDRPEERVEQAKQVLAGLPAGLTHFVIHPAVDTPELRAITPDWPSRVADYQAFTSQELRAYVQDSDLNILGYRDLKVLLREQRKEVPNTKDREQ
jgi:predicted glycoside hydrolase/deacetylase ChbG (UPF0249 family)